MFCLVVIENVHALQNGVNLNRWKKPIFFAYSNMELFVYVYGCAITYIFFSSFPCNKNLHNMYINPGNSYKFSKNRRKQSCFLTGIRDFPTIFIAHSCQYIKIVWLA